uniref:Uncharacterized protein n=1 Tax=Stegastes partitus TaxID=144197 RepID=A0A3B5BBK4_9TELE
MLEIPLSPPRPEDDQVSSLCSKAGSCISQMGGLLLSVIIGAALAVSSGKSGLLCIWSFGLICGFPLTPHCLLTVLHFSEVCHETPQPADQLLNPQTSSSTRNPQTSSSTRRPAPQPATHRPAPQPADQLLNPQTSSSTRSLQTSSSTSRPADQVLNPQTSSSTRIHHLPSQQPSCNVTSSNLQPLT